MGSHAFFVRSDLLHEEAGIFVGHGGHDNNVSKYVKLAALYGCNGAIRFSPSFGLN